MSKKKRSIITIIICVILLMFAIGLFFIVNKDKPNKENNEVVSSEVSSNLKVDDWEAKTEEIEENKNSTENEIEFVEPDESEADKVLEEIKNNKNNKDTSSEAKPKEPVKKKEPQKESSSKTESSKPAKESENTQTFEDGQKELETEAEKYLKEHNIDPKTAGETGELCPHCNKKIWNPDKYGFFIPGMPEDYENSGYCLGTCAITFG